MTSESLTNKLSQLEAADLIRQAHAVAEVEYLFKHNLVQDAAYSSLLRHDRRHLHELVGATIEQLYPERLADYAPILAEHYYEAGDDKPALRYYELAGDIAAAKFASAEACMHYNRAIDLATRGKADKTTLSRLYTRYGRMLELDGRYDTALAIYETLRKMGEEMDDRALTLEALAASATIYAIPTAKYDPARALTLSQEALPLARELGDQKTEARILWNLLLAYTFNGKPDEAIRYGEESLALSRRLNLREQTAYTLNDLYTSYFMRQRIDKCYQVLVEARTIWKQIGNLPMLADNLNSSAELASMTNHLDEAIALAMESREISASIGNLWGQSYSSLVLSIAYINQGWITQAIRAMQDSCHWGDQAGFLMASRGARASLAYIYALLRLSKPCEQITDELLSTASDASPLGRSCAWAILSVLLNWEGRYQEAGEELVRAITEHRPDHEVFFPELFILPFAITENALAKGTYQDGLQALQSLVSAQGSPQALYYRSELPYYKARLLWKLGKLDEALGELTYAESIAVNGGSADMLWRILAQKSQILEQRGDPGASDPLRSQVRQIVNDIVLHLDEGEIRDAFLHLPDVKYALGTTKVPAKGNGYE